MTNERSKASLRFLLGFPNFNKTLTSYKGLFEYMKNKEKKYTSNYGKSSILMAQRIDDSLKI